jgi:hypothetical protein
MTPPEQQNGEQESSFHTYVTHRIPWYVHMIWMGYLIALVWYLIQYAVPSARDAL